MQSEVRIHAFCMDERKCHAWGCILVSSFKLDQDVSRYVWKLNIDRPTCILVQPEIHTHAYSNANPSSTSQTLSGPHNQKN